MSSELPRAILLGGLIGSGKTTLANALSEKLGAHVYSLDALKREMYPIDPDYGYNMAHGIPFSDVTREKVFRRAVEDFAGLSKLHERVIIEETLHKKSLREILYAGARVCFGSYGVVWIQSDEATTLSRLEANSNRASHILQDPASMYRGFAAVFEPIYEADIVHDNSGALEDSVTKLVDSLTTHTWART